MVYNKYDLEAIRILDDFLPDRIFDGHMHISTYPFDGVERFDIDDYVRDTSPIFGNRAIRGMALPAPTKELEDPDNYRKSLGFFKEQLDRHPDFLGSLPVMPWQSRDEILSFISHPNIKGLKCYHIYAKRENTRDADIYEYLSNETMAVANGRKMTVTLHMVKPKSLSDPDNLQAIKDMAVKYPDAKIILAHSARGFAAWTAIEAVGELKPYENVFFDFSAICESPSIIGILKRVGVSRCMWGSDYTVSQTLGKAISLGDGFYWINEKDLEGFAKNSDVRPRHVAIENLMAVREAAMLMDLTRKDVEDVFLGNACRIFE